MIARSETQGLLGSEDRRGRAKWGIPESRIDPSGMATRAEARLQWFSRLSRSRAGVEAPTLKASWRTIEDVELATLGWVHWHNNQQG